MVPSSVRSFSKRKVGNPVGRYQKGTIERFRLPSTPFCSRRSNRLFERKRETDKMRRLTVLGEIVWTFILGSLEIHGVQQLEGSLRSSAPQTSAFLYRRWAYTFLRKRYFLPRYSVGSALTDHFFWAYSFVFSSFSRSAFSNTRYSSDAFLKIS